MAFAPDGLTSLGGFPGDDYKGGLMFAKIDRNKMGEDMLAAAMWLKSRPDCTGKIGFRFLLRGRRCQYAGGPAGTRFGGGGAVLWLSS